MRRELLIRGGRRVEVACRQSKRKTAPPILLTPIIIMMSVNRMDGAVVWMFGAAGPLPTCKFRLTTIE